MTLFPGSQTLLEMRVDSMVGDDLLVSPDGNVVGTFKYVTGFTEFYPDDPEQQEGYFFPFKLVKTGTNMTFKKNGVVVDGKQNIPFDPEIIFRVNKNDTFEVLVDDESVIKFEFSHATFLPKGD